MTVQRRSLCTWTGMAIGFRAFYAVMVDGGQLYGSAWLAMLAGLIGAVPTVLSLKALRCAMPEQDAEKALNGLLGRQGKRLIALIIFVVLIYDTGAVISLMSSTAKYVAMPEANRNLIKFATALTATAASMMGAAASANAAVLWRRLAAALIVILIGTQLRYFRASWLAPVLGPGVAEIGKNALPAAGIFSFAAAGWLMLEPAHDKQGWALLKCTLGSGMIAVLLSVLLCMLIPGMIDEPAARGFRIGRLLANDRAGLTLEMPYVVLLYSGMLTMLVFEMCASANALHMILPGIGWKACGLTAGILAFSLSVSSWTDREQMVKAAAGYYPLIAVPFCAAGLTAWNRMKRRKVPNEADR